MRSEWTTTVYCINRAEHHGIQLAPDIPGRKPRQFPQRSASAHSPIHKSSGRARARPLYRCKPLVRSGSAPAEQLQLVPTASASTCKTPVFVSPRSAHWLARGRLDLTRPEALTRAVPFCRAGAFRGRGVQYWKWEEIWRFSTLTARPLQIRSAIGWLRARTVQVVPQPDITENHRPGQRRAQNRADRNGTRRGPKCSTGN